MTSQLITKLPHFIVNHIKLFTGEGWWRNGKYIHIHRIPRDDPRYEMLLRRPKIKQLSNNFNITVPFRGTTWFKLPNNKFMVINVQHVHEINGMHYNTFVWELYYNEKKTVIGLW
jgi:hypothetical protein